MARANGYLTVSFLSLAWCENNSWTGGPNSLINNVVITFSRHNQGGQYQKYGRRVPHGVPDSRRSLLNKRISKFLTWENSTQPAVLLKLCTTYRAGLVKQVWSPRDTTDECHGAFLARAYIILSASGLCIIPNVGRRLV